MWVSGWAVAAGAVASTLASLLALGAVARWAWQSMRAAIRTLDAINGTADRPGISQRLSDLETSNAAITAQVMPNGGASMRDALDRIDRRTRRTDTALRFHLRWHRNTGVVDPTAPDLVHPDRP